MQPNLTLEMIKLPAAISESQRDSVPKPGVVPSRRRRDYPGSPITNPTNLNEVAPPEEAFPSTISSQFPVNATKCNL
jgi:hypothetical protein